MLHLSYLCLFGLCNDVCLHFPIVRYKYILIMLNITVVFARLVNGLVHSSTVRIAEWVRQNIPQNQLGMEKSNR